MQTVEVAILGAGAAGLAMSIFAARSLPGRRIVAMDGARQLGAKILASGGGHCNVSNRLVTPGDFCGSSPKAIRRVLAAFGVEQTMTFFHEIGVELHEGEQGKLFPTTNRARTVLQALLGKVRRQGVELRTEHRVTNLDRAEGLFRITTSAVRLDARSVVLDTGGMSLPETGSDGSGYVLAQRLGHSLVPPTPALVPFLLEGDFHTHLAGVSHNVELTVLAEGREPTRIRGPLLWTHFGASGPAVLEASRYWHRADLERRRPTVWANFLPGHDFSAAEHKLLDLTAAQPRLFLGNSLAAFLPARVARAVLVPLGIDGQTRLTHLSRDDRRKLIHALLNWPIPVRDTLGYDHAEVTAGGVPLTEINPATMESRKCPGLYLTGEILDVDGRIGGFNFQWAWSSAWVAATGIAQRCSTRADRL